MRGLFREFERLVVLPEIARERTEYDPPVRIHPHRSHIIVYQVVDDQVLILRIRHGREDWASEPE
jgi:toxin ParE1/3/4